LPETHETVIDSLNEALNGDWSVSFERGKGVPETVGFDHLVSWTDATSNFGRWRQVFLRHGNILEDDRGSGQAIWRRARISGWIWATCERLPTWR
jgi:hypothetical protein